MKAFYLVLLVLIAAVAQAQSVKNDLVGLCSIVCFSGVGQLPY